MTTAARVTASAVALRERPVNSAARQQLDLLQQSLPSGGSFFVHSTWASPAHRHEVMRQHTKRHVSFKSRFSFVERPLHPKTVFERGDPRLDPRPPCLSALEPPLLFTGCALHTQRSSTRQDDLVDAHRCSQPFILRAPVTAIGRRQPWRPTKERDMVLQRRRPLLLVGSITGSHFIPADDALFDLIQAHQTSKLVGFMGLAFANHDAMGFEQAQYLLWIMPLGLEKPRLRLRHHSLDQRQIMAQPSFLAQHPRYRFGART